MPIDFHELSLAAIVVFLVLKESFNFARSVVSKGKAGIERRKTDGFEEISRQVENIERVVTRTNGGGRPLIYKSPLCEQIEELTQKVSVLIGVLEVYVKNRGKDND